MKILRWILLILYITIVIGLLGMKYQLEEDLNEKLFWPLFVLAVTVIAQTIFIFGAGTINLCTPIRKGRLIIPVIIAAVLMTVLAAGITFALGELLFGNASGNWFLYVFWTIIALSWLAWSVIFFIWGTRTQRYKTLRNFISTMFAGSLLTLMVSIPSHIIASRRSYCFAGMATAAGIISGIFVMLWAFGPGIILLFLREKRKAELLRNGKVE